MERVTIEGKGPAMLYRFPSVTDAGAFSASVGKGEWKARADQHDGESGPDAARLLRDGDVSRVAASDRMLTKMEGALDLQATAWATVGAVAGGAVNVGAYLAGSPMSMRQRRRMVSDVAPVAVIVDSGVSQAVTGLEIERRGAAALALVRAVSTVRPVTLFVVAALMGGSTDITSLHVAQIETAPLDLARAAYALQSPAMLRRVFFEQSRHASNGDDWIKWAFGNHKWVCNDFPAWVAGLVGAPDFVAVPATLSGEGYDLSDDDAAAAWVRTEAQRLLA